MMKNVFLLALALLPLQMVPQQNPFYKEYRWDQNPSYSVDTTTAKDILELKSKIVSEFVYDKEGALVEYFLEHKVLWLNSDHFIEEFNKVYLPYSSTTSLVESKARVINKDGKIFPLDESDIYTAKDEETGRQYKYFAFEGLEKGSYIEYYYVEKKNPDYNGKRYFLQSSIAKKEVGFDVFAPRNLVFQFKTYNGLPRVMLDTLTPGKLHWKLRLQDIPKLENEELSAFDASRKSVIYKLDQNLATNARDISSYGKLAQNVHAYYYPEHSNRTEKRVRKFLEEAISEEASESALIRELEFYIKNNIYLSQGTAEELEDLDEVLKQKVANETGLMKLFTACLTQLGVDHELVLTSDRQELKFDKDFEATNFLTTFLIYFPQYDAYLAPTAEDSRFGFPPAFTTDNYGLFIREVTVGNLTSAVGQIQYIEPVASEKTVDQMFIKVSFTPGDPTRTKVHLDRSMSGYYAMYMQPYMHLVKQENKDELIASFAKNLDEGAEIEKKSLINADPLLFGRKPLQFVIDFESDAFVEKAGSKYIFQIGELIGQQVELYQEKERTLPLENEFQRSYRRTLQIQIPEGYRFVNLDDLNIHKVYSKNGEELLSFHSYFEIKEGVLFVTADEHYSQNILGVDEYEEFRTVINSAADFNKVSLIMEPVL